MRVQRLGVVCFSDLLLFTSVLHAAPVHDWSKTFGVYGVPLAKAVATDGSGNVLVAGDFEGTVDFGGGPLWSTGCTDVFVAKYDSDGAHVWSRRFGEGDYQYQYGSSIAVDEAGNVIVAGSFWDVVDFGGGPLASAGSDDHFVAKFDPDGNHLWSRRFGDVFNQADIFVAVDGMGDILLTGYLTSSVDFGGGPLTNTGAGDVFIAKLDSGGNHLWSRRFGDPGIQAAFSIAVDDSGNALITGGFNGAVDFGGGPLTSAGSFDVFVASFDAEGDHLWSRSFGDAAYQRGESVAVDESGKVVVIGYFYGAVDFGDGSLTSAGNADVFLASFDAAGNSLWSRGFGSDGGQLGSSIAADASGNITVTGFFEETVDFGGGPLISDGGEKLFVASFDAGGNHLWSRAFENVRFIHGSTVATDESDNVVFIGGFSETMDLGGGPLTSGLTDDSFVAKFDAGGDHVWSQCFGELAGWGQGRSIAADSSGNSVVTGTFSGVVDFGGGPITNRSAFVASFDAAGGPQWSRGFGYNVYANSVSVDGASNVVVTGAFADTVDFGGGSLGSAGSFDVFVASFDTDGNSLWSRSFGDENSQTALSIAWGGASSIVLSGRFEGVVDFGNGPLTSAGGTDLFVAKLDANGDPLWSRRFGDAMHQGGAISVDVDGMGNILVAGYFEGAVDLGGGALTSAGYNDVLVAKLDPLGNHLWSRRFGDTGGQSATSVAVDGAGGVIIAGFFQGVLDFGGGPLTFAGNDDIFVARFDADGNHSWSRGFGSGSFEWASTVAVDGAGNAIVAGLFADVLDFGGGPLIGAGYDFFVASFDPGGSHLWSQRFGNSYEQSSMFVTTNHSGDVFFTGAFDGPIDFGGGPVLGNGPGSIFVAKFHDDVVPVRIASFDATVRQGAVEIRWDVWSDEALERYTLYRQDDDHPQAVAIAEGPIHRAIRSYVDADVVPGRTYRYELAIRSRAGEETRSQSVTVTIPALPATLGQNFPNPFSPKTTIQYTLGGRSRAVLNIYDAAGKLVRRLDHGVREPGTHVAEWDGRDDLGRALQSGVYFYNLEGASGVARRKMLLVR